MSILLENKRFVLCMLGTALCAGALDSAHAATGPRQLVRGYIAASPPAFVDGEPFKQLPQPIYLPGIRVFLRGSSGTVAEAQTDLSGRFTLSTEKIDRYRVCWEAKGYEPGCSKEIIPAIPVQRHLGTQRIEIERRQIVAGAGTLAGSATLYGKVRLQDGALPRRLEPLANINAFAEVSLLDGNGKPIYRTYVNNFGEYLLPKVPRKGDVTVQVSIEGAKKSIRLHPGSDLGGSFAHRVDLTIANHQPRLEPVVPLDGAGLRVQTATPGDTVLLKARGSDPDGDPLRFKWLVDSGSGALSAVDQREVKWTLPGAPGRYAVTLVAYDGKGGYSESRLSLQAGLKGVPFSGHVRGTDGLSLTGAQVEINGVRVKTDAQGFFRTHVAKAGRYVLNIRKPGYALASQVYDGPVTGGRWTLTRATITTVDPGQRIHVVNKRTQRECPGPAASRVDWRRYRQLLTQPVWQDGKGNVVAPSRESSIGPVMATLIGDYGPARSKDRSSGRCGPGIQVEIPANVLVDQNGNPPSGPVDVQLSTVDLFSPEQMPGDYTVLLPSGDPRVMQSYGAGTVEIFAGDRHYNLRPGATAKLTIPVDRSQLEAGGPLPPTIPLLYYDEAKGVWVEDGQATLQGTGVDRRYVAKVSHFSAINTDLIKQDQACVRVLSPDLPAQYNLEVAVPLGGGAAPKILSRFVDNAAPSEHVIYNLPTNTNIVLVPIRIPEETPMGTFVVNTGGQQNPTNPNLPVGPPYLACATSVTLTEQAVPDPALAGEFLHGLFSFEAINLGELDPADPTAAALATALDDATADYYSQIDPRGKRPTLAGFQSTNGFPVAETRVAFANSGDLGFGRDMHCTKQWVDDDGDGVEESGEYDVACYVTNYGDHTTPDTDDAAAAVAQDGPVATVAMEYSRIESPPGDPVELDDPERVVKFYVYNADGSALLNAADLDGFGARPIPQLCMVCHGGAYPGGFVTGAAPAFGSRDDVKLGSRFLPFDVHFYTFASAPFDKAGQQAEFETLNKEIVAAVPSTLPGDSTIEDVINGLYPVAGGPQDESFVVAGWSAQPIESEMYREVVARTCRSCHIASPFPSLKFDQSSLIKSTLGSVESRVCAQHVMPHAQRTYDIFWTSVGPHMPSVLQIFGDTFDVPPNDTSWAGNLCGEFIPGGETPESFYHTDIQPIWDSNCGGCHIGGAQAGLSLAGDAVGPDPSYGNIVNVDSTELPSMKLVQPGDANNSYLFHKLQGTHGGLAGCPNISACFGANASCGGQMPCGGALSAGDLATIQAWINSGAPGP